MTLHATSRKWCATRKQSESLLVKRLHVPNCASRSGFGTSRQDAHRRLISSNRLLKVQPRGRSGPLASFVCSDEPPRLTQPAAARCPRMARSRDGQPSLSVPLGERQRTDGLGIASNVGDMARSALNSAPEIARQSLPTKFRFPAHEMERPKRGLSAFRGRQGGFAAPERSGMDQLSSART